MSTPRPPVGRRSAIGGSLDRQTAGNLAHRRKQRQPAVRIGHGLIGNGRGARCHQAAGLLRIRREMKIGEERSGAA